MANFLNSDGEILTSARDDGTGKPVTDVQVTGSIGEKIYQESVSVNKEFEGSERLTLIDTEEPFVIDFLEWSAGTTTDFSIQRLGVIIERYSDGEAERITRMVTTDGELDSNTTIIRIVNNRDSLWDIKEYDTSERVYKFSLRNLMFFPQGGLVEIGNVFSTGFEGEHKLAGMISARLLK